MMNFHKKGLGRCNAPDGVNFLRAKRQRTNQLNVNTQEPFTLESISKLTPFIFFLSILIGAVWSISYYFIIGVFPDLSNTNIIAYLIPVSVMGAIFIAMFTIFPYLCIISLEEVVGRKNRDKCSLIVAVEHIVLAFILLVSSCLMKYIHKKVTLEFFDSTTVVLSICSAIVIIVVLLCIYKYLKISKNKLVAFIYHGITIIQSFLVLSLLVFSMLRGTESYITIFVIIFFLVIFPSLILRFKNTIISYLIIICVYLLCLIYTSLVGSTPDSLANAIKAPIVKFKLGSIVADLHIYDNASSVFIDGKSHTLEVLMLSSIGSEYIFKIGYDSKIGDNSTIYRLPKSSNIVVSYPKLEKTVKKKPEQTIDNKVEKFSTLESGENRDTNTDK